MLFTFKRAFLLLLLVLTGWTAVLVAYALFRTGRSPETLGTALYTTLTQGVLLLVCFAAFLALDRKSLRPVALCGLVAAALMLLVVPVFAWWRIASSPFVVVARDLAQVRALSIMKTGVLTAGLLCLVPFVLIPRMQRVGRIVQWTTILYMSVAYITALAQIWDINNPRAQEALTTLLIPAGACMLGVFAVHKFLEIRPPNPLSTVQPTVHLRCPRCQHEQEAPLSDSRCARCRLRIHIAVEEPLCPNCHFNLHHLTRPLCPECGMHLDEEEVARTS
jgi:hypothetical protein